ncbi:uncharacterized protein Tco025E_09882 [Trypanosoma conorhini]|uniref:Uncharacterized protein n=1 Tax=Trypanosoma conorhini TaxID=83891 RepID=A0A422MRP2_9TRYP|nr:uncharacterized protein Tco025E_09882 [Trypanosoma conorhini]RNE95873.1 hypothetical protein Tco025E_09882 [Trypanosoma conorhini]
MLSGFDCSTHGRPARLVGGLSSLSLSFILSTKPLSVNACTPYISRASGKEKSLNPNNRRKTPFCLHTAVNFEIIRCPRREHTGRLTKVSKLPFPEFRAAFTSI